jgi:hypothetical protein
VRLDQIDEHQIDDDRDRDATGIRPPLH